MSFGQMEAGIPSAATTRGLRMARRVDARMPSDAFSGSMTAAPTPVPMVWLMLAGIGVSLVLWSRLTRRDARLIPIYLGALAGAFSGAKLVYLAAEGWLYWHDRTAG